MAEVVAKVYGEALFQAIMESEENEKRSRELIEEITTVRRIVRDNPELDKLMLHPVVLRSEKIDVLRNIFGSWVCPELMGLFELVIHQDRYTDLPDIFKYFLDKLKAIHKIGKAEVTSAVELTYEQKARIHERLLETTHYNELDMSFSVEPELLGGIKIRINDRIVDGSVRTKLEEMKKELLQIRLD